MSPVRRLIFRGIGQYVSMIRHPLHRTNRDTPQRGGRPAAAILLATVILAASCGSGSGGQNADQSSTTTSYTTIPNAGAPEGPAVKSLDSSCVSAAGLSLIAPDGYGFDPAATGPAACVFLMRSDGLGDSRAIRINGFAAGGDWRAAIIQVKPFIGLTSEFDESALPVAPVSESLVPAAFVSSTVTKMDATDLVEGSDGYVIAGVRSTITQLNPEKVGDPSVNVVVVFADGSGAIMALVNGGAPTFEADLVALRSLISTVKPSS